MDVQQRDVPALPTEVYAAIISTFRSEQDLIFLWTVLRNVSQFVRDLVDDFVRRRHLHYVYIIPKLTDSPDLPMGVMGEFKYISSVYPEHAVFDMARKMSLEDRQSFIKEMKERTQEVSQWMWRQPRTIVTVRSFANDTELPDAKWDEDRCEVSVNWREMLGALLWEEKLQRCLSAKWVKRTQALKSNALANGGSSSESNNLMKMVMAQRGARDESAGEARHKRILRQLRRTDPQADFKPTREDIEAFEAVEMARQTTNGWSFD